MNLTKLEPPKPVVTKPPPPKARFAEPQRPAAFTDFYKEDKKEAPTSDDAEILAMEANIKEYKAQEKRRAIKAAKARAARQERAMKAKIIEERAKKQQQEAEEVWVDGRRVDEKQASSSSDEDAVDELHDCKPTKKKSSWFNWKPQTDEDVALTADELAYAGDFGTDEEARVQRKLVPKAAAAHGLGGAPVESSSDQRLPRPARRSGRSHQVSVATVAEESRCVVFLSSLVCRA